MGETAVSEGRKRHYSSREANASDTLENKIQRVEDFNDCILPRFSSNSVLLATDSGQIVESVVMEDEKEHKKIASHNLTSDASGKKPLKRKGNFLLENSMAHAGTQSLIASLHSELDGLFKYFKEVSDRKLVLIEGDNVEAKMRCLNNWAVACLLEESELPFSKLVEQIYTKLKENGDSLNQVTLAAVRSSVLFVGQRSMYGIPKADADVLEDESSICLWCWETRDLRLLPKAQRTVLNVRRTCRKKIHERIMAVSAMISSFSAFGNQTNSNSDMLKAAEKYAKALNEKQIRALAESLMQKHGALEAEKAARLKEKAMIKEVEQNKRMIEKEQKRLDRELKKEQQHYEKELKVHTEMAEGQENQLEKEDAEIKKQQKWQQEEAIKDEKRRAKQEAELKKQLAIKKQASMMERFLKRKVCDAGDRQPAKRVTSTVQSIIFKEVPDQVASAMDLTLSQAATLCSSEILRSHLTAWRCHRSSVSENKFKRWGIRRHPKVELIKELRLQEPSCEGETKFIDQTGHGFSNMPDVDEMNIEKLVDGWAEAVSDDRSSPNNVIAGSVDAQILVRRKKLLQFDKSHRPAYFGTISKTSNVVGPRRPFWRDPKMDYDNDSDEEWEEEDPGERLSDFDKDEEEKLDDLKAGDEDESEDSFVVPDGYLSENEGVQVEGMEFESSADELKNSNDGKLGIWREEMSTLVKQQKYLCNLTDHALRKNKPLIILNLLHEKDVTMTTEDLDGTLKLEHMCLEALSIQPVAEGDSIYLTTVYENCEDNHDTPNIQTKSSACTTAGSTAILQDSDISEIVCFIQSSSQGIHKVMESLQRKFPSVPKAQLKNKVKEIADFVDNQWQVKKEILNKLGLSVSPDKDLGRSKGIASFFTKRCLPPENKIMSDIDSSPQQYKKANTELRNVNVANIFDASR